MKKSLLLFSRYINVVTSAFPQYFPKNSLDLRNIFQHQRFLPEQTEIFSQSLEHPLGSLTFHLLSKSLKGKKLYKTSRDSQPPELINSSQQTGVQRENKRKIRLNVTGPAVPSYFGSSVTALILSMGRHDTRTVNQRKKNY